LFEQLNSATVGEFDVRAVSAGWAAQRRRLASGSVSYRATSARPLRSEADITFVAIGHQPPVAFTLQFAGSIAISGPGYLLAHGQK